MSARRSSRKSSRGSHKTKRKTKHQKRANARPGKAARAGRSHRVAKLSRGASGPRTATQLFALSACDQDQYRAALTAITDLRAGKSIEHALREAHIGRSTLFRWAGPAFRKSSDGRYTVRAADQLLRVVYVPDESTPDGKREVETRDSRQATLVSNHWQAVRTYLQTGDATALTALEGRAVIDAKRQTIALLTDRALLDRLASAGVLSFESIYAGRLR